MNPASWSRIKELFGAAIEVDAAKRRDWIREACGSDDELRTELESLLSSWESEESLAPETTPIEHTVVVDRVRGRRIGAYELIRQIGIGGMGAVYLAVRADEIYRKNVAIKVVQAAIGTQEILERFRHERQILATFDHPNIAKLLDGGVTEEGLPFFAMDYIEGVRIDEYCAENALSINRRIELFCEVCSAVQYVHQNLVVHRDLKPGNILVNADGVPKLLDFGIAKLLKPEIFGDLTRAEFRPMTPAYASPEQMRGEAVTTASDVYSLGVILYELLTSRSPYRLKSDSPHEAMIAVCEQEPEQPSDVVAVEVEWKGRRLKDPAQIAKERGTSTEKLKRQLKGDLDNITLRALRKEPRSRYSSAAQLADDLRRYLAGLPVSAHRGSWSYRAGKFIRRNAVAVAAAAIVVVSLTAGILVALWQARVARSERAIAQQEFNDVRRLTTSFLFEFDGAIRNLRGSTAARKLLVHRALEYLSKLNMQSRKDPGLERELAEAYLKVGDVQGNPYGPNLGDTRGAAASYREALRISQVLADEDPGDTEARLYEARSWKALGQVLPALGSPTDGFTDLKKASATLQSLAAENPQDETTRLELASTYQALGDLQGHSGLPNLSDPGAALESYRRALSIYQEQSARNPGNWTARSGLALLRVKIADMAMTGGNLKRGLAEYRDALQALEQFSAADPANAQAAHLVELGYRKVGGVQEEMGDTRDALINYGKAAAMGENLLRADPGNRQAAMALAITLRYSGDLLSKLGNRSAALADYDRVLQILNQLSSDQPGNVLVEGRRAEMLVYVAGVLDEMGQHEQARRRTLEALAITRKLGARPDVTADDLYAYAVTFLECVPADLREPATALAYAQRSAQKSGWRDTSIVELLARAYFESGDSRHAVETEERALQMVGSQSPAAVSDRRRIAAQLAVFRKGLNGR